MPSRYEREIEDILEKAGIEGSDAPRRRQPRRRGFWRLVWLYARQSLSGSPLSITPGRVMLLGVALLLSFLLVRPFNAGVAGIVAWAGLIVFIIGYGYALARPRRTEARWRGKPVDDSRGEGWLSRLKRRIRGR